MDSATTKIFKALAHPARRKILTLLLTSDRSVKQLTASFKMSQPAVSQHLRELRNANLVTAQKIGSEHEYRLTGKPLRIVFDWCAPYRRFFDPSGHAWQFTPINAEPRESVGKGGSHRGR